jgi:hypothetical protein
MTVGAICESHRRFSDWCLKNCLLFRIRRAGGPWVSSWANCAAMTSRSDDTCDQPAVTWFDGCRAAFALGRLETIPRGRAHHRLLWIHPFADGNGRVACSQRALSYEWSR